MKRSFLLRFFPIYIIMVYALMSLSGCASPAGYEGKDLIDRAKALHTGLEAAHITVREYVRSEGEPVDSAAFGAAPVVQEITYRFATDVMQYMYTGLDTATGEEYYEFNNGTELDTWHTGDTAWSFAAKGGEDFYNYSRASRHYFADGTKLLDDHVSAVKTSFLLTDNISSAGTLPDPDSGKDLRLVFVSYDSGSIGIEGASEYSQAYYIDGSGYCVEQQIQYSKDGRIYIYDVRIEAEEPAAPIDRIEPPALSENTENTQ